MEIKELEKVSTGVFGAVSKMGHEQVVFCHDEATGLKAIIAIHNTTLELFLIPFSIMEGASFYFQPGCVILQAQSTFLPHA